jgi:hypothetical protein
MEMGWSFNSGGRRGLRSLLCRPRVLTRRVNPVLKDEGARSGSDRPVFWKAQDLTNDPGNFKIRLVPNQHAEKEIPGPYGSPHPGGARESGARQYQALDRPSGPLQSLFSPTWDFDLLWSTACEAAVCMGIRLSAPYPSSGCKLPLFPTILAPTEGVTAPDPGRAPTGHCLSHIRPAGVSTRPPELPQRLLPPIATIWPLETRQLLRSYSTCLQKPKFHTQKIQPSKPQSQAPGPRT